MKPEGYQILVRYEDTWKCVASTTSKEDALRLLKEYRERDRNAYKFHAVYCDNSRRRYCHKDCLTLQTQGGCYVFCIR